MSLSFSIASTNALQFGYSSKIKCPCSCQILVLFHFDKAPSWCLTPNTLLRTIAPSQVKSGLSPWEICVEFNTALFLFPVLKPDKIVSGTELEAMHRRRHSESGHLACQGPEVAGSMTLSAGRTVIHNKQTTSHPRNESLLKEYCRALPYQCGVGKLIRTKNVERKQRKIRLKESTKYIALVYVYNFFGSLKKSEYFKS